MSGDNNYAVVLNFYEKIDPPGKFPTFVEGWHHLGKYVQKLDHFVATQLHRNVDPNGKYKFLNYATFDDTDQKVLQDMTQPSIELLQALGEGHGPPGLQTNYPGGYHETRTSSGPVAPDVPAKTDSCFLVSAFKATEGTDLFSLEDNVKKLCGLDIIADSAASSGFRVGPWAVYRRFTPSVPFKPYDIVFRCELLGLGSVLEPAQDLVQELEAAPILEGVEESDHAIYAIEDNNVLLSL